MALHACNPTRAGARSCCVSVLRWPMFCTMRLRLAPQHLQCYCCSLSQSINYCQPAASQRRHAAILFCAAPVLLFLQAVHISGRCLVDHAPTPQTCAAMEGVWDDTAAGTEAGAGEQLAPCLNSWAASWVDIEHDCLGSSWFLQPLLHNVDMQP